jgi:hypothetical protein
MKRSQLVLIFSGILICILFLILWLTDYSPFNIPEFIPVIELQTYGVLSFLAMIVILVLFLKRLIRFDATISIVKLTLLGLLVCLIAQSIYQTVRQFYVLRFNDNDKAHDLVVSMISLTILSFVTALCVALELKKSNQIWRMLSTILALAVIFVLKKYFPAITW